MDGEYTSLWYRLTLALKPISAEQPCAQYAEYLQAGLKRNFLAGLYRFSEFGSLSEYVSFLNFISPNFKGRIEIEKSTENPYRAHVKVAVTSFIGLNGLTGTAEEKKEMAEGKLYDVCEM